MYFYIQFNNEMDNDNKRQRERERINKEWMIMVVIGILICGTVMNMIMITGYGNESHLIENNLTQEVKITKYGGDSKNKVNQEKENALIFQIEEDNAFNKGKSQKEQQNAPQTETKQTTLPQDEQKLQKEIINDKQDVPQWQKISSKTPTTLLQLRYLSTQRIKMGKPKPKERPLKMWLIEGSSRSHSCSLTNSINILTSSSVNIAKLLMDKTQIGHAIFLVDGRDKFAEETIGRSFGERVVRSWDVAVDADYGWVRGVIGVAQCQRILYLGHGFKFLNEDIAQLSELLHKSQDFTVYYSNKPTSLTLPLLTTIPLHTIPIATIQKYLLIFDSRLLSLITPINYSYYARYTVQQILVMPVLVLGQKLGTLVLWEGAGYQVGEGAGAEGKEFQMLQLDHHAEEGFCLLSQPADPHHQEFQDMERYLTSILNMNLTGARVSVILYLPHTAGPSSRFNQILKLLHDVKKMQGIERVRLRIRANTTVSSLSAYQSVYTYCPKNSLIISNRHNIQFNHNFIQTLANKHRASHSQYYFITHTNAKGKQITLSPEALTHRNRNISLFTQFLSPIQVFSSALFRRVGLWVLKKEEIGFYDSQASFVFPMLDIINYNITIIKANMFTAHSRPHSPAQSQQLSTIATQLQYKSSYPNSYNSLLNPSLRRNSPPIIPKIIHLTSTTNVPTIKQNYPQYRVEVWTDDRISQIQFPLTYHIIVKYRQSGDAESRGLMQSMMIMEALYHTGGISMSDNHIPTAPLQPFLKYPLFCSELPPLLPTRCLLGAVQHNYHLHILLTQLATQPRTTDITWNPFNDEEMEMEGCFRVGLLLDLPY